MVGPDRSHGAAQLSEPERLARALAAIDDANADDPNRIRLRGELRPKELAHAELACEWVARLLPDASEALRLAARAHHLRRWAIPRADYPEGRVGYHRWRRALQAFHADEVARILQREGYGEETIARVRDLVTKRGLGRDAEVQTLEDALCLVFLETQLGELRERFERDKVIDILRKSLRKMSPEGVACAREISLDDADAELVARAVELEGS